LALVYLGGLVLGGGDEVGAVLVPLEVGELHVELVDLEVVDELARLAVVLGDGAVLVAGDDELAQVGPAGDGGLAGLAHDGHGALVRLLGLNVEGDVEDDDGAEMAHALLRDAEELGAVLVELDALHGGGELPRLEALARLDVPELDGVVGGPGGHEGGGGVDVDGPDGTDVAVVCSEALAIVGEPDADLLVLGDGEDEVAVRVVPRRQGEQGSRVSGRSWMVVGGGQ